MVARRALLCAAAVMQLAGLAHPQRMEPSQQQPAGSREFCAYVQNAATVRVRHAGGASEMCTTMYCLSDNDDAGSGNCRCTRSADEVCDGLNYVAPEPEPENSKIDPNDMGSADRLVYQANLCAAAEREGKAAPLYCDHLGRTPQLYWLFVIMVVYILIATAVVRTYRKIRTKRESQFYKAIRDGVVKIDVPDFDTTGEMDMRMSVSSPGSPGRDSAGDDQLRDLGIGHAAGDILHDVSGVLGIRALTEVGGAVGDKVDHIVTDAEGLALEGMHVVENVEKQLGKMAEKQVRTVSAILFGDFMSISRTEMAEKLGSDALIYLMHLKQCGIFFLSASLTYGVVLTVCYQQGEYTIHEGLRGRDWALYSFTVGALANPDPTAPATNYHWVAAITSFCFGLNSIYWTYSRWKKLEKLKIGSKVATNSKNTIMIKNIPKKVMTKDLLQRYFSQCCPNQVLGVRVALNVHGLCINVRQQKAIYRRLNQIRMHAPWLADANNYGSNQAEAKLRALHGNLVVDLHQLEADNARLRQHEPEGAGCAFVTFKCEAYAQAYFSEAKLQSGRVAGDCNVSGDVLVVLQRAKWEIQNAPLQHDIYWENLATQESEAVVRTFGVNALLVGLLVLFVLTTFATVLFIGMDFMSYIWQLDLITVGVRGQFASTVANLKANFGQFWFYALFGVPPLLLFLALAEAICPIVRFVSKFEHVSTRTEQQSTYLSKCYFYYMVLHLWCGSCGFIFLSFMVDKRDRMEVFLTLAAMYHLHKFFLEIFVYLPVRVMEGVGSFFRPTQEIHVEDLGDAAEEEDPEFVQLVRHDSYHNATFDYSRQYGESLALFAMAHVYAVACPPMMFFCGAWFMAKYAVDKYILAKHYSRARISYGRRARMITKWTLSSVVIGQVCIYVLWRLIGQHGEATLLSVSTGISVVAFIVYINRKFKIPILNIEVNLVGLVMKHSPLGKLKYTAGINNVMNEFHEGDDEDEEDEKKKAGKKQTSLMADLRPGEEPPRLYDVPTLDTLHWQVEAEVLWEPGMPMMDNPIRRSGQSAFSPRVQSGKDPLSEDKPLSHLQRRKLQKEAEAKGEVWPPADLVTAAGYAAAPKPRVKLALVPAARTLHHGHPRSGLTWKPEAVSPHGRVGSENSACSAISPPHLDLANAKAEASQSHDRRRRDSGSDESVSPLAMTRDRAAPTSFDTDNAHDMDPAMAMAATMDHARSAQTDNPLAVSFEPDAKGESPKSPRSRAAKLVGSPGVERRNGPSRSGQDFLAYRNSMRRLEPVAPMHVSRSVVEEDV